MLFRSILKTKGKEPKMFRTYDLHESWQLEENKKQLRSVNKDSGNTISLRRLDQEITFPALPAVEPDEPNSFIEIGRAHV